MLNKTHCSFMKFLVWSYSLMILEIPQKIGIPTYLVYVEKNLVDMKPFILAY